MKCFICFEPVDVVIDGDIAQAENAVICSTNGNYGSCTIDDPPFILEFVICDICVIERREHFHAHKTKHVKEAVEFMDYITGLKSISIGDPQLCSNCEMPTSTLYRAMASALCKECYERRSTKPL